MLLAWFLSGGKAEGCFWLKLVRGDYPPDMVHNEMLKFDQAQEEHWRLLHYHYPLVYRLYDLLPSQQVWTALVLLHLP